MGHIDKNENMCSLEDSPIGKNDYEPLTMTKYNIDCNVQEYVENENSGNLEDSVND